MQNKRVERFEFRINKNNYIKQYIYNTHPSNLPLGANKPQRFTNAYNEQIIY